MNSSPGKVHASCSLLRFRLRVQIHPVEPQNKLKIAEQVSTFKYLGILKDNKLSSDQHVISSINSELCLSPPTSCCCFTKAEFSRSLSLCAVPPAS